MKQLVFVQFDAWRVVSATPEAIKAYLRKVVTYLESPEWDNPEYLVRMMAAKGIDLEEVESPTGWDQRAFRYLVKGWWIYFDEEVWAEDPDGVRV